MTVESSAAPIEAAQHMPPLRALIVVLGLIVAIAGYLALARALGVLPTFAGMLFLFYWFGCKAGDVAALPGALLGGLAGILNGALFVLPGLDPGSSALIGLAVVILAIYLLLIGFLPLIFNQAYMLMVTVSGIPALLAPPQHVGMAIATTLSAAYFGGIVWTLKLLADRKTRRQSGAA